MAKVVSFNKDVPSLKAQPKPDWENFDLSVTVVHLNMGKDRDVQRYRVRAEGVTRLYQRAFETRDKLLHWLVPQGHPARKEVEEALDRAVRSPNQKVELPVFSEEEDLVADGFRLISGD